MLVALDLLLKIRQAEQEAEKTRQDATHQAREILSGVEEATAAQQRQNAVELRGMVQSILEDARIRTEKEIEKLNAQNEQANDALCASAQARRGQAAQWIFERIVNDGHC